MLFRSLLSGASSGGPSTLARLKLSDGAAEVSVQASLFRQDGSSFYLVRLGAGSTAQAVREPAGGSGLDSIFERLPDAFVVTDMDGIIRSANSAFLDMAGLVNASAAIGEGLDQWLGRAGVDFGVLKASIRDGGVVRNFSTVLRNAYGAVDGVEISAVGSTRGHQAHLGFLIRPASRASSDQGAPSALPRSAEEFKQLVGRVPLKELVRETSDIIEKLCIEAALELTGDNRASAAEMLGLSRQGLYAKLHRFGIGDLSRED